MMKTFFPRVRPHTAWKENQVFRKVENNKENWIENKGLR
jgi:hypothetical protein